MKQNLKNNTVNRKKEKWIRPWNTRQFNDIYNRDERFISIILKGVIAYLNSHVKLYDKGINHFIFNTGSSYMYVESNGYEFMWNETSGEDTMYMEMPRCVIQLTNISIPTEELSQAYARGNYERKDGESIRGFNAEIRRLPLEFEITLNYVFSNFNEGLVVIQELLDKFVFQKYFKVAYLGQIVQCSIEFPLSYNIEFNHIDLAAAETNQKNLSLSIKVSTNYPIINEKTEITTSEIISKFGGFINSEGRSSYIEITIDGVKSNVNDIYLDFRSFDFDNDGKIDETEIEYIQEFISRFDVDEDGIVTSNDINIISEEFYDNIYNVKYDITNKGEVDLENLSIIKHLHKILDIDHDEIVSQQEIDIIIMYIHNLLRYDINNDLKIDYNDVNNIITYITSNTKIVRIDIYNELNLWIEKNIINNEFKTYVLNIINNDIKNYRIAIEYYINTNVNINIDKDVLDKLYELCKKLKEFDEYDFNDDGILDDDDINKVIDDINDNIEHKIQYYYSSSIILHLNDHTLSESSITDIEPIKIPD